MNLQMKKKWNEVKTLDRIHVFRWSMPLNTSGLVDHSKPHLHFIPCFLFCVYSTFAIKLSRVSAFSVLPACHAGLLIS